MVVAKGKRRRSEREEQAELEKTVKVPTRAVQGVSDSRVRASDIRGVIEETIARIRAELYPSLQTHDDNGNVTAEIKEEAYILSLVMIVGHDSFQPRQGLTLREAEISDNAKYCKEHS